MRLLLYQPNHTGHHYAYLARMLPGLVDLPVELVLATTEQGVGSDEFEISLAPFGRHLRLETCCTPPPKGVYRNAVHRLRQLIAAVQRTDPDHMYVLYGDALWQLLSLRSIVAAWPLPKALPIEAWLYRGGFTYPQAAGAAQGLKRRMFRHLIRRGRLAALHLDDELMFEFARQCARTQTKTRLVLTPNPVELRDPVTMAEARRRLGLDADRRIVCSTGMVSQWKGMDLLLEAFAHHLNRTQRPSGLDRDQLVLAGPHADAIKAMLASGAFELLVRQGRVVSVDRYLTTQEMYDFAAASDLTVASYPKHSGRSSIILWAAAAGRPCLGTAWGCIGHVINTERLGMTCNVLDRDEFADHIGKALDMPWTDDDARRVRQYAQFHRLENYQMVATTLLRETLESRPR